MSGLSLFLLHLVFLDLREEIFLLSCTSALTFRRTARWIFHEERLARSDTWKIEIGSCNI
jgi:hypothetical protein